MKEISIEEKAKRYDEAIKIAKEINNEQRAQPFNVMTRVFPELKESEDERIRKWLICTLKSLNNSPVQIDGAYEMMLPAIAWLENQGEEIIPLEQIILNVWELGNYWKELTKGFCNTEYGTQLDYIVKHWKEGEHYIKSLKKQGEQKPADKIEPKFKIGDTIRPKGSLAEYTIESISGECYHGKGWGLAISGDNEYELVRHKSVEWSEEDETGLSDALWAIQQARALAKDENDMGNLWYAERWLKSLKYRILPKPAWSEEDEEQFSFCCAAIELSNYSSDKHRNFAISFLESLKDRVQPKVELTQLDKNILEAAIAFVEQNNHFNCWRGVDKRAVLSALYSLKPQHTWKPSDEQLDALHDAAVYVDKSMFPYPKGILMKLYKQLKKLREE